MKKILLFSWEIILVLVFSANIYAQNSKAAGGGENSSALIDTRDMRYEKTPLNKLGRGIINTLTCWAEIPAEAYKVSQDKDPLTGCTLGVVEGFFTAMLRGLTGIFDAVTFIIPPYDKPLMKPEYALTSAFEKFREHKDKGDWEVIKK